MKDTWNMLYSLRVALELKFAKSLHLAIFRTSHCMVYILSTLN